VTVPNVEPVIGLEIHAQILTRSKMFCTCSAAYAGAEPNTHVCAVCGGMPGSLPVINARAVEGTVLTAVALNCVVPRHSKFDRKNYSYPDLPKGYQITQYDLPIGRTGWLEYEVEGATRRCGIVRVHLEEDTGKSVHTRENGEGEASFIDYNRSGVPLMEIVTEPDLRAPAEARAFFASLRQVLMYLGVNDGNLQEGSLRADVNVSIRAESGELGTKVEIKNLNSFRAVERALAFEIERQATLLTAGERIEQETRGWSEGEEITLAQRSKEYAHDYRYFPEPDLPPLDLTPETVDALRVALPEMPLALRDRLVCDYGLNREVAEIFVEDRQLAEFFEAAVQGESAPNPVAVGNWLRGEVLRLSDDRETPLADSRLSPQNLAQLVRLVERKELSSTAAKEVLARMFETGEEAAAAARRLNKLQISDAGEIARFVDGVLAANADLVAQYRAGKTKVAQALVGLVMRASEGRANPDLVQSVLRQRLDDPTFRPVAP
jgi:aspartyl-tRNA(Asn)/glutamyl-tRNA(Gln) amidotransferase subunit B